jgi:hypothetical protein
MILRRGIIMVTLLSPKQNKPNTVAEEPESTQIMPRLTEAESTIVTNKRNCWASIVRTLAGLRELLAGPPMTQQDRDRQALTEARARNATALHWFYWPLVRSNQTTIMSFMKRDLLVSECPFFSSLPVG